LVVADDHLALLGGNAKARGNTNKSLNRIDAVSIEPRFFSVEIANAEILGVSIDVANNTAAIIEKITTQTTATVITVVSCVLPAGAISTGAIIEMTNAAFAAKDFVVIEFFLSLKPVG
jgi:hypothetical protein